MSGNRRTHTETVDAPTATDSQPGTTAAAFVFEVIDRRELARRWNVPASWISENTRSRAKDKIPHVKFGRYTRFLWGDPRLAAWFERRCSAATKI